MRPRSGVNPSIYAAATILILTVSTGIITYSILTMRAKAQRERDAKAAERAELAGVEVSLPVG